MRRDICVSSDGIPDAESVIVRPNKPGTTHLGAIIYFEGVGAHSLRLSADSEGVRYGLDAHLANNVDTLRPVRAVLALGQGFHYLGLYGVEDAWSSPGLVGARSYRFRLRSLSSIYEQGDSTRLPGDGDEVRDVHVPAPRQEVTHYRLVRDGKVPLAVKELYDYACQVCGVRLETAGGPYAEGAHIVPLGGEQAGNDDVSNVLCLCPNDHVRLDHGAISFTDDWRVIDREGRVLGRLNIVKEHPLDVRNARLHRKLFNFTDA